MFETTAKELLPRENRYPIRAERPLDVAIQRVTLDGIETITGRVLEISRNGVKLTVSGSLPFEENVPLTIQSDELGVEIEVEARICWGRPGPGSTWTAGCRIAPALDEKVIAQLAEYGCLDRREGARTSIRLLTTVQWELQSTASPVSLTDLSSTGFGMRSAYCPALGQRLLVHVENEAGRQLSLPAQVEWTSKEKGGYGVGCCLLKSDDVRHLVEAARRHQRTFPPPPTVNPPYSPWMFAALMVIAFIGPSVVYGLFRTLASTDPSPSAHVADATAHEETTTPVTLEQIDSPNVEHATTADRVAQDLADDPTQIAHSSSADEGAVAATSTADAESPDIRLPDIRLRDTNAVPEILAEPPVDVSVADTDVPTSSAPNDVQTPPLAPPEDVAEAMQTTTGSEPPAPVILMPDDTEETPPLVIPPFNQPARVVQTPVQPAPVEDFTPVPPRHVLLPAVEGASRVGAAEEGTPDVDANSEITLADEPVADVPPSELSPKPPIRPPAPVEVAEKLPQPPVQNAADVRRATAWWDRSYEQYRQGQLRQAVQSLKQASDLDGANPVYVYLTAMIHHQLNDAAAAQRMIQRAADLERSHKIDNWGGAVRRYQGRPRVWLERARNQALSRADG